ncbi:DUF4349 domain-containing protein [Terrabacter sp. MAHUQ-38]|uniref:DUF4349 domain-containing protein n=1 Tax=unclassified Terrabacter TaxID=2630222 RepID=UPI00165EA49F|nr:DUF4349 domain-containing protein [Terrabacter sp. MAHUQ-38]MBC9823572.1 DUF4349 domain-containing protein [Terrabacter sp. MAHUQ-38]
MTDTSRLPRPSSLAPSRRRLLAFVVALALVLVAAVPLGLRALSGASPGAPSDATVELGPNAVRGGTAATPDDLSQDGGAPAASDRSAKSPAADAPSSPGASVAVIGEKLARTAWLGIKVTDLTGAAARARVIATSAGGQVTSENVVTADDPTGGPGMVGPATESGRALPRVGVDEAGMVLSVPAESLDKVLTELSRIGSVSYRSSQTQDVTDTYVDTKARIQPMRDGIDRLRALLAKTTELQQIITLESELTRRQAELDSLTQRLAQLDKLTTMSDVTVSLWTDATTPVEDDNGPGGGLRTAWESFLGSLTVIVTGLAVLLPWLVILVPLILLALRRWRRRDTGAPVATSHAAEAPGAGAAPQPVGAPTGTSATGTSATGTSGTPSKPESAGPPSGA